MITIFVMNLSQQDMTHGRVTLLMDSQKFLQTLLIHLTTAVQTRAVTIQTQVIQEMAAVLIQQVIRQIQVIQHHLVYMPHFLQYQADLQELVFMELKKQEKTDL